MNPLRILVGLCVIALVGLGCWRWYERTHSGNSAIRGSGIIEVTEVDVAFEVPGRLAERRAEEGAFLDRGEPVARLDDREYQLRAERARSALAAAEARYRMMVAGSRAQDVDQALAAREAAETQLRVAEADHGRIRQLFAAGVVSRGDLDRAETALAEARAGRDQTRAQLAKLQEGFRTEEVEEARARLRQAEKEMELAELDLTRCELFAPLSGRVLSKSREPGEMVQPGATIVTLGDLSRPWVNLYVSGRDLGLVRLGMKANVTVDSFPDRPFAGTVTFVSDRAEFTPKNIQTPDERVKLVYRVKIEVESTDGILKPGMPADVELSLDS